MFSYISGFEYKGCFWNDNLLTLYSIAQNGDKFYNNTILNSTVVCFEHCIADGFMYAGTHDTQVLLLVAKACLPFGKYC